MILNQVTEDELKIEAMKKAKRTGSHTKRARRAEVLLYDEVKWGDRKAKIKDNGMFDRDMNDIYYEGYDEE